MIAVAATSLLAVAACSSTGTDSGNMDGASANAGSSSSSSAAANAEGVMVGGAEMLPTNTIVQNAALSQDHKTLVAAVKAAGLEQTLSGPGPYTVFAPTDAAFQRLGGVVDQLMMPAAKSQLQDILNYHVVSGDMSAEQIMSQIENGGGTAMLTTLQGGELTAKMQNGNVALTDARGNTAYVTVADAKASNGVVHVLNGVLLPPAPANPAPTGPTPAQPQGQMPANTDTPPTGPGTQN
ncbi:hypothetical protein C725_0282 [Pacificimonas flava]|uniref:FAS1 domain-containing protein n=2 Tax=Pacificimonas flava TaxID=1234595 RepID=M2U8T5_9SPHN|nr:hypothetical protein C725_0282 [Pacificimonas flava]